MKSLLICAVGIWMFFQGLEVGGKWENTHHEVKGAEVVLQNGNVLKGTLRGRWDGGYIITTADEESILLPEGSYAGIKYPVNEQEHDIPWRLFLPAFLVFFPFAWFLFSDLFQSINRLEDHLKEKKGG